MLLVYHLLATSPFVWSLKIILILPKSFFMYLVFPGSELRLLRAGLLALCSYNSSWLGKRIHLDFIGVMIALYRISLMCLQSISKIFALEANIFFRSWAVSLNFAWNGISFTNLWPHFAYPKTNRLPLQWIVLKLLVSHAAVPVEVLWKPDVKDSVGKRRAWSS